MEDAINFTARKTCKKSKQFYKRKYREGGGIELVLDINNQFYGIIERIALLRDMTVTELCFEIIEAGIEGDRGNTVMDLLRLENDRLPKIKEQ